MRKFKTTRTITKEDILQRTTQEYIFNYYGLQVKKGLFLNPLRPDNNPTASFYYKGNTLYLKDFTGSHHVDCFSFVMHLFNLDYNEALKKIQAEIHGVKPTSNTIPFRRESDVKITVSSRNFTKRELDYWAAHGVSKETLIHFNVTALNWYRLTENGEKYLAGEHCYAYRLKRGYKLYFPFRRNMRFLTDTDCVQGLQTLDKKGTNLVITKSLKDVMFVYSNLNLPAIAPQSEAHSISTEQMNYLRKNYKKIFLIYDNDKAGITNSKKLKAKYPNLITKTAPKEKDLTDYYKLHGLEGILKLNLN